MSYLEKRFSEGFITIESRPSYCDRGNFIAKVFPEVGTKLRLSLDPADGWPRYFFDLGRAMDEIEAWLSKRGYTAGPWERWDQ